MCELYFANHIPNYIPKLIPHAYNSHWCELIIHIMRHVFGIIEQFCRVSRDNLLEIRWSIGRDLTTTVHRTMHVKVWRIVAVKSRARSFTNRAWRIRIPHVQLTVMASVPLALVCIAHLVQTRRFLALGTYSISNDKRHIEYIRKIFIDSKRKEGKSLTLSISLRKISEKLFL